MSRAVRRQQAKEPPAATGRPGRGGSGRQPRIGAGGTGPPSRGARPVQSQRRGLRVPRWLQDIISELQKVTWPSRAETRYLTGVVIIVALSIGVMLGVIDIFFNWLVDQLLLE